MTKSLKKDLDERIRFSQRRASQNYWAAYIFLAIAVGASAIATISVAAEGLNKEVNAVLAAIPAIIVGVNKAFPWEARSYWWRDKAISLEAFQRALTIDNRPDTEVNKEMTAFLIEHTKKWPGAGQPPPI